MGHTLDLMIILWCARYVISSTVLRSGQIYRLWLYCWPGVWNYMHSWWTNVSQNYHYLDWIRIFLVYPLQRHFRLWAWKIFLENMHSWIESVAFFRTWKTNLRSLGGQVKVKDRVGPDHRSQMLIICGDWRRGWSWSAVNLKNLNHFGRHEHFKMNGGFRMPAGFGSGREVSLKIMH